MRVAMDALAGAGVTFLLVWGVAALAMRWTGVPAGFPPFTGLPLLSGVAGGYLGASAVYAVVAATAARPERTFLFIAVGVLMASFALPLRLSFTRSARFRGVTPAAQMTLVLLHSLIAASAVTVLTRAVRR